MLISPKSIGNTYVFRGRAAFMFLQFSLFGLSSACYIFTKLLFPLVRYWRSQGLRIIVYHDDGLCVREGEPKALEASVLVCSTLSQAGFLVNA